MEVHQRPTLALNALQLLRLIGLVTYGQHLALEGPSVFGNPRYTGSTVPYMSNGEDALVEESSYASTSCVMMIMLSTLHQKGLIRVDESFPKGVRYCR